MRILELPAYFTPHIGGIEAIVHSLSKEWVKLGHHVKAITSSIGSDVKDEFMDGIAVNRAGAVTIFNNPVALTLIPKILLDTERFDIAHIHHPHPFWIYFSSLACRLRRIPYVFHMHGCEFTYPGIMDGLARIWNWIFLNSVIKHAAKIMTHTQKAIPQSKYMQKYVHKIVYIPHGADFVYDPRSDVRENFIFTVGVREYKRLDVLIRTMPLILKKVKTKLLIAGDGPEKAALLRLVQDLKLTCDVKFLGYISDEQKYDLYSKASVFVLPSPTIMESFGTVAFEAFSMKCPVIVTSGAGISEVFERENIGIVVQPFDPKDLAEQVITVLKNKRLAKRLGEQGYKVIAKRYRWEDIAKQYLAVFEVVVNGTEDRRRI